MDMSSKFEATHYECGDLQLKAARHGTIRGDTKWFSQKPAIMETVNIDDGNKFSRFIPNFGN
ncbi:MAG: hypothetical protein Q8M31_01590 [Beijerinckiaceae bacterium]|nr:hypothetical protein [Beijerinckiaceae bacterium]